ncbi:MAG: hypothetical protein ACOYL8_00395 [Patescibacteria group bacterium]
MKQKREINVFTQKDDMVYVNLVSFGLTGQQWIEKFESEGRKLSSEVKTVLNSKEFIPTAGVIYELIIILGKHFEYGERTISTVREFAYSSGFFKARLEVACLLRNFVSDDKAKEMCIHSLSIVSTHAGKDFTRILGFDVDESPNSLKSYSVKDVLRWRRSTGFVFSIKKIKR